MNTRGTVIRGKKKTGWKKIAWMVVIAALLVSSLPMPAHAASAAGASATATSGTGMTVTIDKPAGTVSGDVLVACIMADSQLAVRADVTAPAGWQLIRHAEASQSWYYDMLTYYKVAGASEPASFVWTSTQFNLSGGITRLTGVDPNHVVDVTAEAQGQGVGLLLEPVVATAPAVTTTYSNDIVLSFFGTYEPLSSPYFTPEASLTELYEYAPQAIGLYYPPNLAAYTHQMGAAGSSGAKSCKLVDPNQTVRWVSQTVAFKAAPDVGFPAASSGGAEEAASHSVAFQITPNAEGPIQVNFTVGGTAEPGVDYVLTTTSPRTVNAGAGLANITFDVLEDTLYEGDETIILTLQSGQGYALSGITQYTYTITNDDPVAPTPVINNGVSTTGISPDSGSAWPIPEFAQLIQINKPTGTVARDFLLAAISWHSTADETIPTPAGWTLIRSTYVNGIRLATYYRIADASDAAVTTYTFLLPVTNTMGGWHATGGITRYTGIDLTSPIDVSGVATGDVGNGGTFSAPSVFPHFPNSRVIAVFGTATPALGISTPVGMTERYQVHYHTSIGNDMSQLWPDTKLCDMNWLPATATGMKTATFTAEDSIYIADHSAWAAQTIALKTSQLSVGDATFIEGNSDSANVSVIVSLDHPTNVPVTFDWITVNGSATGNELPRQIGDDYILTGGNSATTVIPEGQTTKELVVPIYGDTTLEADETLFVHLSNVTGATVADGQGKITILNDDSQLAINDVSQPEGNAGTTPFHFTATLSPACAVPVTVNYGIISGGTATQNIDYVDAPGVVSFAPGETVKTISIPVYGETDFEENETFIVYLSNAVNAQISDARGTGTIVNDDILIPVVSINDVSQAEGNSGTGSMGFTVSLSAAATVPVSVQYATANGTASAGSDYTAVSGTLTIPAGQTSGTISVPIAGDTAFEGDETFDVNLSNPTNGVFGDNQGQGTIRNDDVIHASINDVSQAEGNSGTSGFVFTVTLDGASGTPITIDYATADGTATAGPDYSGVATATLTFAPGETSKTITIQVSGETLFESDETFFLHLSNASGAVIADAQGLGTILNDDPIPTFALSMEASPAGGGAATDLSGMSPYLADAVVNIGAVPAEGYHFTGWSATAGSLEDANAASTSFTMPAQAATVTATFALNDYTVRFNAMGGSTVDSQVLHLGDLVVRPANPSRTGYTFAGWYRDEACTEEWLFATDTVAGDTTLYARWAALDQLVASTASSLNGFNETYAQTFTAGMTGKLYKVSVYLNNYASPITLTTRIQGVTAGGVPNGVVLSEKVTELATVFGGRWIDVILPEPVPVVAGERVAIVWSGLNGGCLLYGNMADVYPGGSALTMFGTAWSAANGYADWCFRTYVLTSPGITLTPGAGLVTTETGGTDIFTVVLNSQPLADVTVALDSADPTEGTVSPASMTFTTANWNVPQTATLTGVDDALWDGDVPYTVSVRASSADLQYQGLEAGVSATNTDVEGIAPVVSSDPSSRSITYGDDTTFSAAATGTPEPTVRWQVSTDGGSLFADIMDGGVYSGANTTTLHLTRPPVAFSGCQYRAVFANGMEPDAMTHAATLTVVPLGITGSFMADNKVYDGTDTAVVSSRGLNGALAGDAVDLSGGTAAFADKNVGTGKSVTLSGATLTGDDAGNYHLTAVTDATADISAKPVDPVITANDKPYDGNANATLGSQTVSGIIGTEAVNLMVGSATFADTHVGTWTVTASLLSLSGADAGNYALAAETATDTADITAVPLTIRGASAGNKVYDGTTAATVDFGEATLNGAVSGDDVGIDSDGYTAAFADAQAGEGKPVTVLGVVLNGTDAGNYTVTQPVGLTADITSLPLTGSFAAGNKVYDGTTEANVAGRELFGVLPGDDVVLSGGTAAFADKHVGTGKTVSLSGATLAGEDAGNYSLTAVDNTTGDITVRPVEVSAVADTKAYDGNTSSDGMPIVTSVPGLAAGDAANWVQTFDTKDAGTGKRLTPEGTIQDGNGGANYQVTFVPVDTGVIEQARLTVTAENKISQHSDPREAFTYVLSGFVSGETLATCGVAGCPSFATDPALGDPILQEPGDYAIVPELGTQTATNYAFAFVNGVYTVTQEHAKLTLDPQNPVSVRVRATDAGNSAFVWKARVTQDNDGSPCDLTCIDKNDISLTFSAVGGGAGWSGKAIAFDAATGIAIFEVPEDALGVETFAAVVTVENNCFQVTPDENVLVVYDPTFGFTTGGGWFRWPEGTENPELAGAKTNFGFTMKYNKKGSNVQGSFLMIAHLPDGGIVRIKSNAINGLAILQNTFPGIASFSGKCVYSRVDADGVVQAESGNQAFMVYVRDANEPGDGKDAIWAHLDLTIAGESPFTLDSDQDGLVEEAEYVDISGGNIVVPHKASVAESDEEELPPTKPSKK